MKNKKSSFEYKILRLPVLVAVLVPSFIFFILQNKPTQTSVVFSGKNLSKKTSKTLYPKQYSDSHTETANAVATLPKFKNIVVFDNQSLLANVISSVTTNTSGPISSGQESGTWLWTQLMTITPSYRDSIILGAKKNGIKTIYLSIDTYLDIFVLPEGQVKDDKKRLFDVALSDFITEAYKNGISVDAEAGWQNWAEEGNLYKAFAVVDYAINFNKTHKEKLRGFQYDVESYLLPDYQLNKSIVLYSFISLIDQSVAKLSGSDLQFTVVVPDFYDGSTGETPSYSYRGISGYTFDHLLRILERRAGSKIIVMSYRNFSKGDDGSVDISKDEVKKADGYNTKIIIAQETGDVPPSYITFHNTPRSYYNKQIAIVQDAFSKDKSFGGIAVHYVNAFLELK